MFTHPLRKFPRFTDRPLSQIHVRRAASDLNQVFEEFLFGIDSGGPRLTSRAHAANVARVPSIARSHVLWRSFQQQYARAALAGSDRRAQRCVSAPDHKDVKYRFFCVGKTLRYFHAI